MKKRRSAGAKGTWLGRHALGAMIAGGVVAVALLFASLFALRGHGGGDEWLYVRPGMDNAALRDTLKSRLGTSMGNRVWLLYGLQGGSAEASRGAYKIEHGQSALSISHRLARGRQTPLTVTFNSARTLDDVARRVSSKLAFSREEFLEACAERLPRRGLGRQQFPAAFLPDSYEFYWSASPGKVVDRLMDYRDEFWDSERRAKAEKLGLTPVQVATLASIVEEETARRDERGKVARVYLNRLKKGMRLQADPTVKFAVGDPTIRRITGRHLRVSSPYNTYQVAGLPPGPIRVAEGRTIDAVLDAPAHNYLYMCARPDFSGRHDFAADYATHQANAARYQRALDARGIK